MGSDETSARRMLKLTVRVRSRDQHDGKPISDLLIALYKEKGIIGATVLQGVRGYGKHGASRVDVLGLSLNLPLVIETVDDEQKIRPILEDVKKIVGQNGLATVEAVGVL
jgi:PII-like signaling protein